jgi:hypothetical protein
MIFSFEQLMWDKKHEVDVPNCQVKFALNIAASCLLARNETAVMACTHTTVPKLPIEKAVSDGRVRTPKCANIEWQP